MAWQCIIGCTGRLHSKNGLEYLIPAATIVRDKHPEASFRFIGVGPEEQKLKEQAKQMGAQECIDFLGYRADIPAQLAEMDIYVQPSLFEGLPNSVLEAMAMGLPVVATHVGGTPELVQEGITGFLVPPKEPEAIAEKLMILLENQELRREMGRAGRKHIERYFTVEKMVEKTDRLFECVIRRKLGLQNNTRLKRWVPVCKG